MTIAGMPSHIAADADLSDAWLHGSNHAEYSYAHSGTRCSVHCPAYREVFETDGTRIGMPSFYAPGGGSLARAYADGYSTRARGLAGEGGSASDVTLWHLRDPTPGASYPPMGERQG